MNVEPVRAPSEKRSPLSYRRLRNSALAAVCGVGALAMLAACQTTSAPVVVKIEVPACQLQNFDGGRSFVVEAWGLPDTVFNVGEQLRLQARTSTPGYMSVFYVSSSCKVTRLLGNHPVKAAEIMDFPTPESGLVMTVKPPAGEEAFYFIATREPLDFLSGGTAGDIMGQAAGVASLDLSPEQFYRRLEDTRGRIDPSSWSAKTLRTRIVQH